MNLRTLPLAAVLLVGCGSTADNPSSRQSFADVPVSSLEEVFTPQGVVTLKPPASEPIGFAAGLTVIGPQAYLADPMQGSVMVFRVSDGGLIRRLGRSGDGPGEFRRPASVTVEPSGVVSIWDIERNALTTWDTAGTFLRERTLAGEFSKVVAMPDLNRFLAPGWARGDTLTVRSGNPVRTIAHEVDSTGTVVASYSSYEMPTQPWSGVFSMATSTRVGPVVVAGTMGSNQLWFRNRESGREWTAAIGAPWYHPPRWPSAAEAKGAGAAGMMKWRKDQLMLVDLLSLPAGQFLASFQGNDSTGRQLYSYVIGDTTGRSLRSIAATPVIILYAQDSVLFGVNLEGNDDSVTLHRFVVR